MSKLPCRVYLGIDYHSQFCTVCLMDAEGKVLFQDVCGNTGDYLVKYLQWRIPGVQEVHAAIEACGGAAQLADDLRRRGWQVELAHAGYVSNLR